MVKDLELDIVVNEGRVRVRVCGTLQDSQLSDGPEVKCAANSLKLKCQPLKIKMESPLFLARLQDFCAEECVSILPPLLPSMELSARKGHYHNPTHHELFVSISLEWNLGRVRRG